MAKIFAVCGSPRKGATEHVVLEALESLKGKEGIETEYATLRGKTIAPCNGCGYCKKNKTWCCVKDDCQELLDRFIQADAYLFASPVYCYSSTPQMAAFFSRMRPLFHVYPELMREKLGAAIAVGGSRNGGEEAAVNNMLNMMMARGINIVSNEAYGYAGGFVWSQDNGPQGVDHDEIGMAGVRKLVNKLADMALLCERGRSASQPRQEKV